MYHFLLENESTNDLLTSWKNQMHRKKVVLELWLKSLQTNQNAGSFKLEYLTDEPRWEIESFYVARQTSKEVKNLRGHVQSYAT